MAVSRAEPQVNMLPSGSKGTRTGGSGHGSSFHAISPPKEVKAVRVPSISVTTGDTLSDEPAKWAEAVAAHSEARNTVSAATRLEVTNTEEELWVLWEAAMAKDCHARGSVAYRSASKREDALWEEFIATDISEATAADTKAATVEHLTAEDAMDDYNSEDDLLDTDDEGLV